ncbi:hypothetical protein KL936_004392 [Ogataea polymorpha]|nr:hypothetical protein KL936_004392 [Ogataea polymorpha]
MMGVGYDGVLHRWLLQAALAEYQVQEFSDWPSSPTLRKETNIKQQNLAISRNSSSLAVHLVSQVDPDDFIDAKKRSQSL